MYFTEVWSGKKDKYVYSCRSLKLFQMNIYNFCQIDFHLHCHDYAIKSPKRIDYEMYHIKLTCDP